MAKTDWVNGEKVHASHMNDLGTEINALPVAHETAPVFVVDTAYGGTLGGGDDTACIQATIDAAETAGGGTVVLPPRTGYVYKAEQLVLPSTGVHFKGPGWHAFGSFGSALELQQLTGVNDDFIIFDEATAGWIGPVGITDIVLRGAQDATAGHGISFRNAADDANPPQDCCTFERINLLNFAESGIYATGGVPLVLSDIRSIFNGGYGVEIDGAGFLAYQTILSNISGDGNMGYVADGGGAVVYLNNLQGLAPAVTIVGIKSEYSHWTFGNDAADPDAMGGFHALIIEDCSCPITVIGVQHLANSAKDRKPGNAIQIKGSNRPNLAWNSVQIRDDVVGQTEGSDPVRVYDEVASVGSDAPHGVWGAAGFATDTLNVRNGGTIGTDTLNKIDIATGTSLADANLARVAGSLSASSGTQRGLTVVPGVAQSGTASYAGVDVNVTETSTGSGTKRLYHGRVGGTTVFAVNNDGSVDVGNASDTTMSRLGAGRLGVEGVELTRSVNSGARMFTPSAYTTGNYYYCNSPSSSGTSSTLTNERARVTAFLVPNSVTITRVFAEFTVAGDTNSVFRIGIWADDGTGKPGTLVLDAGSISTGTGDAGTVATGGTPNIYEITVSQALTPGLYWVGGAVQGAPSVQPTMRTISTNVIPFPGPLGTSLPSANGLAIGFFQDSVSGAFSNFTSSPAVSGAGPARIGFKVA